MGAHALAGVGKQWATLLPCLGKRLKHTNPMWRIKRQPAAPLWQANTHSVQEARSPVRVGTGTRGARHAGMARRPARRELVQGTLETCFRGAWSGLIRKWPWLSSSSLPIRQCGFAACADNFRGSAEPRSCQAWSTRLTRRPVSPVKPGQTPPPTRSLRKSTFRMLTSAATPSTNSLSPTARAGAVKA